MDESETNQRSAFILNQTRRGRDALPISRKRPWRLLVGVRAVIQEQFRPTTR